MPSMRNPTQIAVLCSDLHLSLTQPICRNDDDWMQVQADYLQQLRALAAYYPVICAGDIFDRWNAPPELVTFALQHLPDNMICVPGQHDLPNHRRDQVHRSGYGVLVEAGKILDISNGCIHHCAKQNLTCHGFGWDEEIESYTDKDSHIHLAVIHRYCWYRSNRYPNAPAENECSAFRKQLKGFHAAVFGDNHLGFVAEAGSCNVINTGGFIRRKSDEINYQPSVGILYSNGTVVRYFLDTETDRFHVKEEQPEEVPINMQEFIKGLEELGEHGLNFREAVENHLRNEEVDKRTKQIILEALEL